MNVIKRLFRFRLKDLLYIDYLLLVTVLGIVAFGVYNIFLSTRTNYGTHYVKMQLIFLAVSLVAMFIVIALDYARVIPLIPWFYWFVNILLVAVLFTESRGGASGWFQIGPISIQPAELAKLSILLITAKNMQDIRGTINRPRHFFLVVGYALFPMLLMMLQPEMGLTMVSFFIVLTIMFIIGLKLRVILGGFVLLLGGIVGALSTDLVPDHWRSRIYAFLSLSGGADSGFDTFQLDTARIAIGSGQLRGAENPGYYNWIPVNFTDFIFAVIAENFGFLGSAALLFAFTIVLWRLIVISGKATDWFAQSIAAGMFGLLIFSILQNIGMTIGLMPISGITLPFVSYGGSSLLTNMLALGVVLNVSRRRGRNTAVLDGL